MGEVVCLWCWEPNNNIILSYYSPPSPLAPPSPFSFFFFFLPLALRLTVAFLQNWFATGSGHNAVT